MSARIVVIKSQYDMAVSTEVCDSSWFPRLPGSIWKMPKRPRLLPASELGQQLQEAALVRTDVRLDLRFAGLS